MLKSTRFVTAAAFTLVLFQIVSCRKIIDKILKSPDGDLKLCNIQKMIARPSSLSDFTHWTFTYNIHGDPVSAENDMVGTGSPNFYFRYDASHHLTDFIGLYNNGQYESWYQYTTGAMGRIVKDTQYVFGTYGPAPDPNSVFIREHLYEYDALGRISKVTTTELFSMGSPVPPAPVVQNFNYDASGDHITGAVYDSELNVHRTNRIWMFVDREYSIHNPVAATSYNSWGLPLVFNTPDAVNFLGQAVNFNGEFQYLCP